jgi:hypothetical protein
MRDQIVKQVIDKFKSRSDVGFKKYGVTLKDDEQSLDTWLNHLQEELMDAVNYIEKIRNVLSERNTRASVSKKKYNVYPKTEYNTYPGDIKMTFDEVKKE